MQKNTFSTESLHNSKPYAQTPTMLLYGAKKIFIICLSLFNFMLQQVLKELLQMDRFSFEKKDVSKVYVELYKTSFSDARMPYFKLDFVKKQYQNIKVKLLKVLIV